MRWIRRIRSALTMGITWAVAWAAAGVGIGVLSIVLPALPWDRFFAVFDAPLPALAVPGFVGGVLFSVVVGALGRRLRFDELSIPRFAAWGAIGGLLLSLVPDVMSLLGLATLNRALPFPFAIAAMISVPAMLLGSASASASLWIAQRAERRALRAAHDDLATIGLTEAEERTLLGRSA
jgi:hypothetical protein